MLLVVIAQVPKSTSSLLRYQCNCPSPGRDARARGRLAVAAGRLDDIRQRELIVEVLVVVIVVVVVLRIYSDVVDVDAMVVGADVDVGQQERRQ